MSFINSITQSPQKLFLIDGIGALATALSLAFILPYFEAHIGIPRSILHVLAILPCIYAVFSLTCAFSAFKNRPVLLKIIAFANLFYCCLTIGLMVNLFQQITILGILYFVFEIIIIVALATLELKTASK